ncbi:AAA family ATPase [Acetobacter orleanensis]|uniref:AAA+ ATPase domain-containing protein n=1 Tax=Acetobacter orleanensis TaxID=104099 RepID=A0A4Y3TMH8_9PROT|nr:AAA family ATPase [Acetobacter orleanensis]KXV65373.1 DNA transposition protein [Acetobacter orleanensis]PCD80158.1 DNA transposition protein [Acetobacter orleanensis]GAN68556.1 prophage integrase [Acetobacter orleanensis JCM 7639]GBR23005.1 hypothetical protein AA0473_0275 [Acetobacter orleanensis NRIC 0473]GEB82639.1 hypothetical protein AOR01nite_11160 [Acetobacter orleanensis]
MTKVIRLPRANENSNNTGTLWPTSVLEDMEGVMLASYRTGMIGLLTAPSGTGKTTAARMVAAKLNTAPDEDECSYGQEVIYIMMTRATDKTRPGLAHIADALGIYTSRGDCPQDIMRSIEFKLEGQTSLLILDEAQFMSADLLSAIRNIWDRLETRGCNPGIVLVGTESLHERICGRRRSEDMDALSGRLGQKMVNLAISEEDVRAVCKHLNIMGEKEFALLYRVGRERGGLHNIKRVVEMAEQIADGKHITLSTLKTSIAVTGGLV